MSTTIATTLCSFTHHDPLEDTESKILGRELWVLRGFTHHDPLEDTERHRSNGAPNESSGVSPITIRLRILKAYLTTPVLPRKE